jgi:predicted TIM-barrel fold metal-dependent hydrolase
MQNQAGAAAAFPADAPADAPLVDTHAHVYTLDMPVSGEAWHQPPADATIAMYLDTLDAHGVGYAVMAAASIYGDYNDYMIESTRRHRQRLRTTVIISPDTDPYVMRMMKDDGVVGVRLQWRSLKQTPSLDNFEYRRFFRRVADLDWHVQLHDQGPRLPPSIAQIEKSGAKLVIDHFGRPDPAKGIACAGFQAVLRSVEKGRTWVKLSAGYRLEPPAVAVALARELLKHAGPERLVWGSDWPFAAFEDKMRYQATVDDFHAWVPDAEARRRIGGETALKLFFT